jgi:hypothetical protein
MSMLVFVFGDSIAWGLYDDRGGWVGRLGNGRSRLVYNLGVFGSELAQIAERGKLSPGENGDEGILGGFAVLGLCVGLIIV